MTRTFIKFWATGGFVKPIKCAPVITISFRHDETKLNLLNALERKQNITKRGQRSN